jgi:outer membrane protein assembly factor BamB
MANGNDGPFKDEATHAVPAGAPPIEPGATDADILWAFDMIKELNVRQHDSAHCSILLHGQFLYVNTSNGLNDAHNHIDSPDAPSLIVLDKTTGRLVATDDERIGPRIFHSTWSSPALGEVNGKPRVFFGGGDGVVYAFETVRDGVMESWSNGVMRTGASQHSNTPPLHHSTLRRVWRFDCDPTGPKENVHQYIRNRHVSPSNIKSMPVFHNGRLYVTVGGDVWWGKNEAWLKCIDAAGAGDITKTAERWSYPLRMHCMSTPAVHSGLVFINDCGKTVHCVDAETGKPYWTHETRYDMWASPLVADGKVHVGTRRGEFLVFAASKEKKLLGSLDLGEPIHGSPIAANGTLYIATMSRLYAVQQAGPPAQ